jgi:hypothetical protein
MRHQPTLIHRVAGKAAAEMIVDAALADVVEGDFDGGEVAGLAGAQAGAPQQLEQRSLRKFRCSAGTAVDRIDDAAELARRVIELRGAEADRAGFLFGRGEPRHQRHPVVFDLLRLVAEQPRDLAQHVNEGGLAVARGLGKISAAPDRLAGGREKHGERPAAVLAEVMQRRHVDLVDVGPLLAVDFDVDEQVVHHGRGAGVLKALVRHDVAPVAGRVTDRQQDRLAGPLRLAERVRSPGPPGYGIVLVLQKIRAGLLRKAVGFGGCGHGRHADGRPGVRQWKIARAVEKNAPRTQAQLRCAESMFQRGEHRRPFR